MAAERRSLKMHPALLWSVIERQAGTIAKAILEGGMNSVDAGATFCDIKIDDRSFSIIDDGKGFRDETEIENFFETFGYPHKEGDAKYGQFRMGRGQMFSFGRNVWRTGIYQMTVDMKPQKDLEGNDYALGYEFEKFDENVVGCHINVDLYEELLPSTLDKTIREIKKYLRYVNIPVTLNGERISVDPASEKWDEITDDAFIKRKTSGNLEVYNLGVLVKDSPSYYTGVSGVVVSKKQLKVNFARNDIQSDCPVWKRVNKLLQDQTLQRAQKATPLTDAERGFYIQQIASGEVQFGTLRDTRVLTDVTGSHHPLKRLQSVTALSIAPIGDRVAEMAHTRKLAFVLSTECAERFGVSTPDEFVTLIKRMGQKDHSFRWIGNRLVPIQRSEFDKTISSHHEPLKDKELNKAEMMALRAIREGAKALHYTGRYADIQGIRRGETFFDKVANRENPPRRISVGVSDTADAWTNGTTDIWINRKILSKMKRGLAGYMQVSGLLLHEYIHRGPSTGTHDHGVDFYEAFHNYSLDTDVLQKSSAAMMKSMLSQLRAEGKAVSNILSSLEDDVARGAKLGLDNFDDVAPEVSEEVLDADFSEGQTPDGIQPVSLAARSSEAPKKTRRPKASDDSQFQLKF
jgi:DNA mismatch repair enzyme (predicted ATPase)